MIYLYRMPDIQFNIPSYSICLIKGFLKSHNIDTLQKDLTIEFLKKFFNKNFIKNRYRNFYKKLNDEEKSVVNNIEKNIKIIKNKKTLVINKLNANLCFKKYMEILGKCFGVKFIQREIIYNKEIDSVDKLINYVESEEKYIFKSLLNEKFKVREDDIFYFNIQYSFQLVFALKLAKKIKKYNKKSKVILGGDYITHIKDNIKELMEKIEYIDSVVFHGIVQDLYEVIKYYIEKNNNKNKKFNNVIIRIENIVYCFFNNNKKVEIDTRRYIPEFENINFNEYLTSERIVPLTLNYGCYHAKCKFCSRYHFYNGYKEYNLNKVLKNIIKLYYNKNITAIYLIDECVPAIILHKFSKLLIKNNINLKWMVETRVDNYFLKKEVIKDLYKSGCRQISLGIESNNKKILKRMNKNINLKIAKKVLKKLFKNNISVAVTLIIGYPNENILEMIRTLMFAYKFKYIDTFGISIFEYMRNSKLVEIATEEKQKDLNLIYRINNSNRERCINLLELFQKKAKIKKFYSRRKSILYRTEYMFLDKKYYSLNYKGEK